jgi:hypothetical protein
MLLAANNVFFQEHPSIILELQSKKSPAPIFQKRKREFAMYTSKYTDQLEELTGRCHALDGLLNCIHWKGDVKKKKRRL